MATQTTDETYFVYGGLTNGTAAFEGAASDYTAGLRGLFQGEADELAVGELRYLQSRSNHICRNNGYGEIALNNWVTNTNGVNTVWIYANGKNKGKKHTIMQDYWASFAENPWYDGHGNLRTGQGVSNSSVFLNGNDYIRSLVIRTSGKAVPLKLQQIPALLHAVEYSASATTDNTIKYGIEFRDSIPINYFFHRSLKEKVDYTNPNAYTKVPASEIIHTFIRKEPGQWLGIPKLASVILALYKLDDLTTATVNKQVLSQHLTYIIKQAGAAGLAMQPVGTPTTITDSNNKTKIIFKSNLLEGKAVYLNPKEEVEMFQGEDIGANFDKLIGQELRKVAGVADTLYHHLTGDTSNLSFAALIAEGIRLRGRLEYIHNFITIPLREKPIADIFKNLAVLYNPKCSNAIPYFQLPRWRGMDELKDMQADLLELQHGMGITTDKLAERGLSIEDIQADAENRKILEGMGIKLTPDQATDSMVQSNNTQANSNSTGN
jgi:capsid protein